MTKIIEVQEHTDERKRTKLILKAIRKSGHRASIHDYISMIESAVSPDFLEKFVEGFRKRRMTGMSEFGIDPFSMIGYNVMKLNREECGFYISRLNLRYGRDPELRIIIEDEDEFKVLWLHNYMRLLKDATSDGQTLIIRDLEQEKADEGGDNDLEQHAGTAPMKCDRCGNYDVSKMLAWYHYLEQGGRVVGGTTTLPKFLYELKYPTREKIHGAGYAALITEDNLSAIKIRRITCEACINKDRPEGEAPEDYEVQKEIEPTRYGI